MHHGKDVRTVSTASAAWSPMTWLFSAFAPADVTKLVATNAPPVSPIENMMRGFSQSGNPWLNAYAQTSMEMLSLATRRSQALMKLPVQAAQCKSPLDLIGLQVEFVQNAVQQHTDAARKTASVWGDVLPVAAQFARTLEQKNLKPVPVPVTRDRMVIKDQTAEQPVERAKTAGEAHAVPEPQRGGDRRSAA